MRRRLLCLLAGTGLFIALLNSLSLVRSLLMNGANETSANQAVLENLATATLSSSEVEGMKQIDPKQGSPPMSIMTFNIRSSYVSKDGRLSWHSWHHRKNSVPEIILRHRPFVVGLQELQAEDAEGLLNQLGPTYARVCPNLTHPAISSPILYDRRQLAVEACGAFGLSDKPYSMANAFPGATGPQVVTWGKFKVTPAATAMSTNFSNFFYAFNAHLDPQVAEIRLLQLELILKQIPITIHFCSEEVTPVFLIGDFNSNRTELPWQILTGRAAYNSTKGCFFDAWQEAKRRVNPVKDTWHGFLGSHDFDDGSNHMDFIFYEVITRSITGNRCNKMASAEFVEVLDATVILDGNDDGLFPSDHYPVVASFVF